MGGGGGGGELQASPPSSTIREGQRKIAEVCIQERLGDPVCGGEAVGKVGISEPDQSAVGRRLAKLTHNSLST